MSRRIIANSARKVLMFNRISKERKLRVNELRHLRDSVNSYLGIMKQYSTYRLRRGLLNRLDKRILNRVDVHKKSCVIVL